MAFQGNGLISKSESNYFSFHARKPDEGKLPNVSDLILGSEHTLIIDSKNRNLKYYPDPSNYIVNFPESYKNVTSIELKGSVFPKSEHNVNSSNYIIPFNVEDYITSVKILNSGFGYVDGNYNLNVSSPAISGGTQAELSVTVSDNKITNVVITEKGSGYLRGYYGGYNENQNGFYSNSGANVDLSSIPKDLNLKNYFKQADLEVNVGHLLLAKLRYGQYDFTSPNDSSPGLCREITKSLQDSINEAISSGTLIPLVGGPQNGSEYFPYGTGNSGSCFLTTLNENASPNNRVCIQRGNNGGLQSMFLELLWGSCDKFYLYSTSRTLLGYGSLEYNNKFAPNDQTSGTLSTVGSWSSQPVIARNDYNLFDSFDYFIMELGADMDRIESNNDQLEKSFATLVFDANQPNVVWRAPPSTLQSPGTGDSDYNSLLSKPGQTKPIKGQDFDTKKISFTVPLAELKRLDIKIKKSNGEYYNFQGRDHLLVFTVGCNDINTSNRF